MGSTVIPIGIGAAVGAGIGWLLNFLVFWFLLGERHKRRRAYAVHPKFRSAFSEANAADIGEPVGSAVKGGQASWHCFYGGAVLWIKDSNRLYQLPFDHSKRKVRIVNDYRLPNDSPYHSPDFVRQRLKLPPDFDSPLGGIAIAWEKDREGWDWLDQKRAWSRVWDNDLLVQEFENGLMMGFVPASPDAKERAVVWLVKDGEWGMRSVK